MTARTRRRQAERGPMRVKVDADGNCEEVKTEAEGIVASHGRKALLLSTARSGRRASSWRVAPFFELHQ